MGVTEVGDLVWARVQGHPQWPGQVMDPKMAPPRAQHNAKRGTVLVSFFGDSSYGWYEHHLLSEFWAKYEENSQQKEKKKQYQQRFAEAIEEAKELWDRRHGRDPTTSHNPPDFLDPNYGRKPAGSDVEGGNDLRPKPAQAEHGKACTAAQVFFWIRAVAQEPFERPKLGPVKVEAAKRQIFSLLLSRNPREQNRRRRKPAGKAAIPAEVSDEEAPPQRGRGSKKGSRAAKAAAESSDASGAGTDSNTLPPPKRGRGGKRARPAAKAAAARSSGESDGDSETPPPPKKRRGGKRAGRAAEASEQSNESDGEEYSKALRPPKRGRGAKKSRKAVRAAAADSSEEEGGPPARKRSGRRKAAPPAAPSSDEDVSDVEEAAGKPAGKRGGKGAVQGAASDSGGPAESEPAPKRRGGRKQKAAQAAPEVEAEALDQAEQAAHEQPEQSKRKRDGRKQAAPKAAAGSAGEAAADAAADAAAEAAAGAAAEAAASTKGRRGRPKGSKNKPKPKPQPHEDAEPGKDAKMEGGESDAETPAQNAPTGRPKRLKRKRSGTDLKEELFSEDEAAAAEGLMASAAGSLRADEFGAEDAAENKPKRGRKPKLEKAALALKKLEGRRLKVELKSVSKMLRTLAEDPMEADPKQLGSAAVAFLRHREQVFVHELARTGDEPSEPLLLALTAPSTKFQRVFKQRDPNSPRAGRRKAGIEVPQGVTGDAQPSEEQYRVKHYTHQLPASREAFDQQLLALYSKSGAVLSVPKLQDTKLDLYEIFKVVAGKGGFEAVSARRQWSKVALEWKPDLPKSTSTSTAMKKHYKQLLLAFEHKVSAGCPQETVQVARAQKAARKAEAPDAQTGRKRKLGPGQMLIPGMGGDLSFSGALGDPAWTDQQGVQFAPNGPMDPTAYAAAAPALGLPQYGTSRPDDGSGDEYQVSQRGRGGRGTKRGRAGSSLLERAQPKAANGAPMGPRPSHGAGISADGAPAAFPEPLQVSDKRRVVMQWQLGSRLPNKGLIRHQLAPFGQVSEDNIAIDHEKAVIEVQFGAAGDASGALIALNRKAETMFSVKQGAVDDILLEEAKPEGFGRSAEPVALQPQQQAAEAQHWVTMQQRMQAEHLQAQMAAQQHQHQHQQPPPLQDPRRAAAALGPSPLDPQMQGQQADGYAWAGEAYGGGPASPPGAALDPRRQPHSAGGQGSSAFRPPPGLGPSALPPSSMQLQYGAAAQGSPGVPYVQPAPHQQQQQPETQAGGGQVSSADVQAILQQLQRTQNGGPLAAVPLSQTTSGPPVLAGDMAVSDSLTLPTLPPIDPRQQPEIGSSLMNLLQQFGGGQGTNLN